MGVALVETAEADLAWDTLRERLRRPLADLGLEWRDALPYPGRPIQQATVEIAPADPITLYVREGLLVINATTARVAPSESEPVSTIKSSAG